MIVLLAYLHSCYIRSYRFGLPTFLLFTIIVLIYSVVPNYVMNSYAFSTVLLFIVSAIVCYTFIDVESVNQESITLTHCKGLNQLYISKLLYSWLFTIPLTVFTVFYPIIIGAFDRSPTIEEVCMSFIYHLVTALLGVIVASWFNSKFIQSRLISFLSLTMVVLVTLSSQGIEEKLPHYLKKIILIIPPVGLNINVLTNYESATIFMKWYPFIMSLVYISVLVGLFFIVLNKRKLAK